MRYWYSYVVPSADPRLASSYQLIPETASNPLCLLGTRLCAIKSPEGGLFPRSPLSINLQSYIAASLANGRPQPELPNNSNFYVYLKP
jgi:hypothetical protein